MSAALMGKATIPLDAQADEVAGLIRTLHATGQRLEELTAGQVDAVSDGDGKSFLLQHAQERLRSIEATKLDAILNALPAQIALLDFEGRIVAVNLAWRRFECGNAIQSPGHAIGVNYIEACGVAGGTDPESLAAANGARAVLKGEADIFSIEYPCHAPGKRRWFVMTATPLAPDRRAGLVVMHVEVTAERETEESLRESERRFSEMLANVELIAVMLDRGGRITYCNDYLLRLTGWAREEVIGGSWFERFNPPAGADARERFSGSLSGMLHATHYVSEILTRAGGRRRIQWNNTMLRSSTGEVVGSASIGEDITERTRSEEEVRRLHADLERRVVERTAELEAANKELEAFDYSVSHDLRAPLTRIEGFTAMLEEQCGDMLDARGRDLLARIADAGRNMDQLVGDLFALSTITHGELDRRPVNLGALAGSIIAGLRRTEPERDVRFLAPTGMDARADAGLMRAVLENLIGNAWKFTRRRAQGVIEMGCTEAAGESIFFVRDNGAGFDSAGAAKLFTPFQRLHSRDDFEGTGIGLATVQRIVRRHGGRVWAQGAPGEGATFFFTLPP